MVLDGGLRVLEMLLDIGVINVGDRCLHHYLLVKAVSRRRLWQGLLVMDGRRRRDLRIKQQRNQRSRGLDIGKYLSVGHRKWLAESRRIQLRLGISVRGLQKSFHGDLFVHGVEEKLHRARRWKVHVVHGMDMVVVKGLHAEEGGAHG
jgi:hypothetical protein